MQDRQGTAVAVAVGTGDAELDGHGLPGAGAHALVLEGLTALMEREPGWRVVAH